MKSISCLIFFILMPLIGCSGTTNHKSSDTTQYQVSIMRFDKDFYNYLQQPSKQLEDSLTIKYATLLPAFVSITDNGGDSIYFTSSLREYFSHPVLKKIYQDALLTFADVSPYEAQLTQANQLIGENFQGKQLPALSMHVSGFKENVIVFDNLISISTDKYLGSEYPAYQEFFQGYQRQQMQPDFVVRDYLKAWLMSDLIKTTIDQPTLLSAMVQEGKILYALSVLLPNDEAKNLIGYTTEQMNWVKENEKDIWKTIVKKSNLFTTDHMLITRYINDAPYTMPISQQSPGRVGCWIGWQIVDQYAKKSGATLQDILKLDAQTILKEAKYNP